MSNLKWKATHIFLCIEPAVVTNRKDRTGELAFDVRLDPKLFDPSPGVTQTLSTVTHITAATI